MSVRSSWFIVLLKSPISLFFFCVIVPYSIENGILEFSSIVELSIFPLHLCQFLKDTFIQHHDQTITCSNPQLGCKKKRKTTLKPFVGILYTSHGTETETIYYTISHKYSTRVSCPYTWVLSKNVFFVASRPCHHYTWLSSQICYNS